MDDISLFFLLFVIYQTAFGLWAQLQIIKRGLPPVSFKKASLRGTLSVILNTAVALLVAAACKISVFGIILINGKSVSVGLALLILPFALTPLKARFKFYKQKKRGADHYPRTTPERMIWVFRSMVAAVGEEVFYRAVLFKILLWWTGDYWLSAAISAMAFALGHSATELVIIFETYFVAIGLQWLVEISGGLYLAIAVHFLHNVIVGILGGIMIKRRTAREQAKVEVISATTDHLSPATQSAIATDITES